MGGFGAGSCAGGITRLPGGLHQGDGALPPCRGGLQCLGTAPLHRGRQDRGDHLMPSLSPPCTKSQRTVISGKCCHHLGAPKPDLWYWLCNLPAGGMVWGPHGSMPACAALSRIIHDVSPNIAGRGASQFRTHPREPSPRPKMQGFYRRQDPRPNPTQLTGAVDRQSSWNCKWWR